MIQEDFVLPYAKIIVRLLKGVIYNDDSIWQDIITYQIPISDYFGKIGIELIVDNQDGYAYIKQIELDDEGSTIGLVKRISISYEVSLICVFLREILDEFDIGEGLSTRCLISHKHIKEHIEIFFKEMPDTKRFFKQIDKNISSIINNLGFLKIHTPHDIPDERVYEIKRIIKAKISSDKIEELKLKMEQYG